MMPALSPTMTSGNLATWKKQIGDAIRPGDIIAEIETDKATMDFEAQEDGFLAKILVKEGSKDILVNQVMRYSLRCLQMMVFLLAYRYYCG